MTSSVVLCAYSIERWERLRAAVTSLQSQSRQPTETIVVIDHNPELLGKARRELGGARVLENQGSQGLSGARNTGVDAAGAELVVFLDDDAVAEPDWLSELIAPYVDPDVLGTGGLAQPVWEGRDAPRWLPQEFYWVVGCSYRGLPAEIAPIRNPIGAGMSFRRSIVMKVGGFNSAIGRVGRNTLGCEETELAIRAHQAHPSGRILHVPSAVIDHFVSSDRMTLSYFFSRCWSEGVSKAVVAAEVGAGPGLSSERHYSLVTLPSGVLKGLKDGFLGDLGGFQRAAAIVLGFATTGFGFVRGRLGGRSR